MGKPVAPKDQMAMAFPDVCKTPTPGGPVPIPYPNIAQFSDATGVTNQGGKEVLVGGKHILLKDSSVSSSNGDEAGSATGVRSNNISGACVVSQASASVKYGQNGLGLARLLDQTKQNMVPGPPSANSIENATGVVLSAAPTVLVGD